MPLRGVMHQKSRQRERIEYNNGEADDGSIRDETQLASHRQQGLGCEDLMSQILTRENMSKAWKRVKANNGTAGVDGLSIDQTMEYLKIHWSAIKEELRQRQYCPQALRHVEIPKIDGSKRILGIPTVVDRLIQQAVLQILQPLIDPTFSKHSYGFRPNRSARDAVRQAQQYVQEGFQIVVDVDLEKFFDHVNHDILMDRLAKRINDKAALQLIRRYLQAGMMTDGVAQQREEGTAQGSSLSPLLANVMLDEVDKVLEQRGHRFVRYADDCNVYVHSQRAGERVLGSLRSLYAKLHLRVNEAKTAVGSAFGRKLLGFCLRRWSGNTVKIAVAPKAIATYKQRIRKITRRVSGRSMTQVIDELRKYMVGWKAYFRLAQTPSVFKDLDSWLRHRLRAIQLKQWRRGKTIHRELRSLGATQELATKITGGSGRWWHNSQGGMHLVLTAAHFDRLGVPRLS
jgi:RNA-directed DNA polymerase